MNDTPIKDCRYTWANAPSWWNPLGEQVYRTEGDLVWLSYWRSAVAISALRLAEEAAQ